MDRRIRVSGLRREFPSAFVSVPQRPKMRPGFARELDRLLPVHQRVLATLIERVAELETLGDEDGALRLIEDVAELVLRHEPARQLS